MTFELSPSLIGPGGSSWPEADAFELKFHLRADDAGRVETWARRRLAPDPNGDAGAYRTTTLYCDTSRLDVYHRSPGFRRSKFRLRRYESADLLFLERKRRRGDRVRKRRAAVPLTELSLLDGADVAAGWPGLWFFQKMRCRELRPACRVGYRRTAFLGDSPDGPIRLTLDRDVIGLPASDWDLSPVDGGKALVPGGVILEMKFRAILPGPFRELLEELPPTLGRISKYRLCVQAWSLAGVPS